MKSDAGPRWLKGNVPSTPKEHLQAVALAASISSITPAPMPLIPRLNVPAIYAVARNTRPPLDLNATVFRYRIGRDNATRAVRYPLCARNHRRSRP